MDFNADYDIFTFRTQLLKCVAEEDSAGFVAVCRAVKAKIIELIHQDRHQEASPLFVMYGHAFEELKSCFPEFLLGIIDVFPVNSRDTFNLLGLSTELDQAIISTKVDISSLSIKNPHAYSSLLEWAVTNGAWPMIDSVVLHLSSIGNELAPGSNERRLLVGHLVLALLQDTNNKRAFSPAVDQALSGLIKSRGDYTIHSACVELMANLGLAKTLMTMLMHSMIIECPLVQFSQERAERILGALPQSPTSKELRAIHHFLKPKGMTSQILFDESIDLDGYLNAMRDSRYISHLRDDLSFQGIRSFCGLMTPENMGDPAKRKRIAKLLNITYEEHYSKGNLNDESAAEQLVELGVPKHAIKLIDRLKGPELDEAMGL